MVERYQKMLWRTSALCKLAGHLVLIEYTPAKDKGKCPLCQGTEFRNGEFGWTECTSCWDFSILTVHLEEISRIWE